MSKVLVTGGSGFVGGHALRTLLDGGHTVTTTVRSAGKEMAVRNLLSVAGAPLDHLRFVIADLADDKGWADAASGCDFVLHVASPFAKSAPENEDEFVAMARDGTPTSSGWLPLHHLPPSATDIPSKRSPLRRTTGRTRRALTCNRIFVQKLWRNAPPGSLSGGRAVGLNLLWSTRLGYSAQFWARSCQRRLRSSSACWQARSQPVRVYTLASSTCAMSSIFG